MELDNLLLTKEELPITHETCFNIPIHPKLLGPTISIDPTIANKVFPYVVEEWYNDLQNYIKTKPENKEYLVEHFLNNKKGITTSAGVQYFRNWEDITKLSENGFVTGFSISRNFGGSLYFNEEDSSCEGTIGPNLINFSEEKKNEFEFKKIGNFSRALIYSSHNIDNYPGALFLRNWAILYMNEVFKEVFD